MGVQGKAVALLSFLLGFGFAALLKWPSSRYTEEDAVAMATTPSMQSPMVSQKQFLQPLTRMGSLTRASNNNNEMKVDKQIERAIIKAMPVAGLLAGPSAAHAYPRTQSLDYLINSLHYGGLLVIVIAAALLAVADLDPVSRGWPLQAEAELVVSIFEVLLRTASVAP